MTAAIPLGVGEAGNLTVIVFALSYAGALTVTLVADPNRVPDLDILAEALQAELDGYVRPPDLEHAPVDRIGHLPLGHFRIVRGPDRAP